MFCDGCRRHLQHVLRKVNKSLIKLPTTQQVEIFNDLEESANVMTVYSAVTHDPQLSWTQTFSCSSRSDSSTIRVQRCCGRVRLQLFNFVTNNYKTVFFSRVQLLELTSATVLLMRSMRFSKSTRLKRGCCFSLCNSAANKSSWCFSIEP